MNNKHFISKDLMSGIYLVYFEDQEKASSFISKFADCPVWPIVTRGLKDNEVFILAVEIREQCHGDFSQEDNTLVRNPHFLGAQKVVFKRDDTLLELFDGILVKTGYMDYIPCGSNCSICPSYNKPCRGCPAYFKY